MAEETGKPLTKEDEKLYPYALVVDAVNRALRRTDDVVKRNGFGLKSGDITFKTVTTNGWGLTAAVFVLTLKFSHKNVTTITEVVHYKDPDKHSVESLLPKKSLLPSEFMFKHKDKGVLLEDALAKHVEALANTKLKDLGGKPVNSFEVSVDFGVDWTFEFGVTVPTPYITVGGSLSHENNNTQSVKLTFERLKI